MRETKFQRELVKKIRDMFPGCVVQRNDPSQMQGIPDLVIFYEDKWAMLEVKVSENHPRGPNQTYYVDRFNDMSYAAFIYPENEEEVLDGLQRALSSGRPARIP